MIDDCIFWKEKGHRKIGQSDLFDATFAPQRRDDLKPGVSEWIGYRGIWEALWMIDEEEGGSYVGMWAMGIHDVLRLKERPPFIWVPECDLVIHAEVSVQEEAKPDEWHDWSYPDGGICVWCNRGVNNGHASDCPRAAQEERGE